MARALVVLAALLLAVPGLFIVAKGFAAIRTRSVVVQGRTVRGAGALAAGAILVGWGLAMISLAALVVAARLAR